MALYVPLTVLIFVCLVCVVRITRISLKGRRLVRNFSGEEYIPHVHARIASFERDNRYLLRNVMGVSSVDAYVNVEASYIASDGHPPGPCGKRGASSFYDIAVLDHEKLHIIDHELGRCFTIPPAKSGVQCSIEPLPLTGRAEMARIGRRLPYELKAYRASFLTGDHVVSILFYNTASLPDVAQRRDLREMMKDNSARHLSDYALANYFIRALGEKYPQIKTESSFD